MPTSTIKSTTWPGSSRERVQTRIKVWPYRVVRRRAALLATVPALVAAAVMTQAWQGLLGVAPAAASNLGLMVVLLGCQASVHVGASAALLAEVEWRRLGVQLLKSILVAVAAAALAFQLFPGFSPPASDVIVLVLCFLFLLAFMRPLALGLIGRWRMADGLLILGSEEAAGQIYGELIKTNRCAPFRDVRTGGPVEVGKTLPGSGAAVVSSELAGFARRNGISWIVVAEPDLAHRESIAAALMDCKLNGLRIEDALQFFEHYSSKLWLKAVHPEALVYAEGFRRPKWVLWTKRSLDVMCALLLLIVTAPLLLLVAIAIKLDSRGPVFFKQRRIGLNGQEFTLYKFRSMRADAESSTGPVWADKNDDRITMLGGLLRRFRIDEIPQAWNVLRGEMSLVGPRPERPYFVGLLEEHIAYYNLRHCVKPGITGLAQVTYSYGSSIEDAYEKLQYDLYYAKHLSLPLDLRILLKTIKVVLFGRGR